MKFPRSLVTRLVLTAICTLAVAGAAVAKSGPLVKFKGNRKGTFTFMTSGGSFQNFAGSGPGKSVFTTKKADTQGSLVVSAHDKSNPAITYSTTLTFGDKGKCTAASIIPGYSDASGKGTWSVKGRILTYHVKGRDSGGSYVVDGTASYSGTKLSIVGKFTISSPFPGAPTGGTYSFK